MDYGAALEMRFGATRRGFESRPLRHHPRLVVGLALATVTVLGACGLGPTPSASAPPTSSLVPPAVSQSPARPPRTTIVPASSPGEIARKAAAQVFASELESLSQADRAMLLDEFVDAIRTRLEGLPAPAAEAELQRMASIGRFRLGDATLLRRLELEAKAMLAIDVPTCAAIARGHVPTGLAARLTAAEQIEDARISVAAIRAEVSGVPEPRLLSRSEAATILLAIAQSASPAETTRIHDISAATAAGETPSDDDACWLTRVPYRAFERLGDADRRLLARYILGSLSG